MEEAKKAIGALFNYETGEIEHEIYYGDKIRLTRSEQLAYENSHIIDFNKGKPFVKIYDEVVPLLEKYLTLPEFKFAICLIPHVSYKDCIIRETQDRRSKILSLKDIATIHNYKYDYVRKLMSSLKNKGVIGKHETGNILENYKGDSSVVYTVNPYIYFRGTDMVIPIHSFYEESGWRELLSSSENNKSQD